MPKRITRDKLYMSTAELFALRSDCLRGQVGVVIIKDHRIVCSGYNGYLPNEKPCSSEICDLESTCSRAIHAEMNAIMFAAKYGIPLEGTILYSTTSPCINCAKAIVQAGISEVVFETEYRDNRGLELLKGKGIKVRNINEQTEGSN